MDDKMGRAMDLMALLEQAQILAEAWRGVDLGQGRAAQRECPGPEELEAYARGSLAAEQAGRLLDHLAACGHCRQAVRELGRRLGLAGQPVDLAQLRADLEQLHPEASAALARLAQAINALLQEDQPLNQDPASRVELGLRGVDGLPSGRWACFSLRRPPYIDHRKHLRLDLAGAGEAPPGCWLRLLFRHQGQAWDLGATSLCEHDRELTWDLADLPILSGYLDWHCLQLLAEQRQVTACARLGDSLMAEPSAQDLSLAGSQPFEPRPLRERDP
ncbi:MAG: hypothetical protein V1806_15270 [Pseudomonadota bacterium]